MFFFKFLILYSLYRIENTQVKLVVAKVYKLQVIAQLATRIRVQKSANALCVVLIWCVGTCMCMYNVSKSIHRILFGFLSALNRALKFPLQPCLMTFIVSQCKKSVLVSECHDSCQEMPNSASSCQCCFSNGEECFGVNIRGRSW